MTSNTLILSSKAESLAKHYIGNPKEPMIGNNPEQHGQTRHRLNLVSFWDIKPGSRVLEIGCGQGDTTVVLADAVGERGWVDAVDPGASDYGSPYTLSQAQSHISSTSLGPRIRFHNSDPIKYLNSLPSTHHKYDYAVLSHCIYYFSNPSILPSLLDVLKLHSIQVCIAEWSLTSPSFSSSPSPSAFPHILSALLQSTLETKRTIPSGNNIRTVLSPQQIKTVAQGKGLDLLKEAVIEAPEGMEDGFWEASGLLGRKEMELWELKGNGVDEKEVVSIEAGFAALEGSVEAIGSLKGVKCMGVWVGTFGVKR